MITLLISILTTGLFVLFVLVLFAAVVFSLFKALNESEKDSQTSQHLHTASFLYALGALRMLRQ